MIYRLVRWGIILLFFGFMLYRFSPHPFNLEKTVQQQLRVMEMPSKGNVISIVEDQHLYSVLFADKEYALFHQIDFKKPFGLFWMPLGGSYGNERKEDILSFYSWGMSTIDDQPFYSIYGYSNDPKAKKVKVRWLPDEEESVNIAADGYFQFAKTFPEDTKQYWDMKVQFFDEKNRFLYELDHMNREIRK